MRFKPELLKNSSIINNGNKDKVSLILKVANANTCISNQLS